MYIWEYEKASIEKIQQNIFKIRDTMLKVQPDTPMYHQLLMHLEIAENEYNNKRIIEINKKQKIQQEEKTKKQAVLDFDMEIDSKITDLAKEYLTAGTRRKIRATPIMLLIAEKYAADTLYNTTVSYLTPEQIKEIRANAK